MGKPYILKYRSDVVPIPKRKVHISLAKDTPSQVTPEDLQKDLQRIGLLYIAFQRCSSTVKKQHTDTGFRAVLAALFSFVQVAVFEPNFF